MTLQKKKYKGLEILFDVKNPELIIDNRKIAIHLQNGKYFTPYMPYTSYHSLTDLSRAVIDLVPSFYSKASK